MTANTCRCGAVLELTTFEVLGRRITPPKRACNTCVEEERARERQLELERAEADRQAVIDMKLRRIPRRFREAKCDHEASHTWLRQFDAGTRRSLVVIGKVGVGKTHELWGMYRILSETRPDLHVEAWSVPTLLDHLRPGHDEDVMDLILVADVIMLDDLAAENPSPWTIERLFRIVDHSWQAEIPIIATTNTPRPRLADAIGERTASRLLDASMTDVVVMQGTDRRHSTAVTEGGARAARAS